MLNKHAIKRKGVPMPLVQYGTLVQQSFSTLNYSHILVYLTQNNLYNIFEKKKLCICIPHPNFDNFFYFPDI